MGAKPPIKNVRPASAIFGLPKLRLDYFVEASMSSTKENVHALKHS